MSSSVPTLPIELYHEIAAQVKDASTLASLCLVSHTWNNASTKPLYQRDIDVIFELDEERNMDDTWSKPCQLQRTIVARPDLAALITGTMVKVLRDNFDETEQAAFHRRDEVGAATTVLNSILTNAPGVVALALFDTVDWMIQMFLDELLSLPDCLSRLQYFETAENHPDLQIAVLQAMPSLLELAVYAFYLHDNDPHYPIPTFALLSLTVKAYLEDVDVCLLAKTINRTSLRRVDFKADKEDAPDWTLFPNLKTVVIAYDQSDEDGQTTDSLATCIVAEFITIRLTHVNSGDYALEDHDILQSLLSSLIFLHLSGTKEPLSEYVLDWLRDGEDQWPNLRWVKMDAIDASVDGEDCALPMTPAREELERVRLACEEVGERRGIEFEWTVCGGAGTGSSEPW